LAPDHTFLLVHIDVTSAACCGHGIVLGASAPDLILRQGRVNLTSFTRRGEEILFGLQTPNLSLGQGHVDLATCMRNFVCIAESESETRAGPC